MGWKRGNAWQRHEYKYQRRAYRCALAFMRQTAWVLRRMLPSLRPLSDRINTQHFFFVRVSPSPSPRPVLLGLGACYRVLAEPTRPGWRFSHGLPVGCRWGPPVPRALSIGWRPCRNKQAADRARDRQGLRESLLEKDVHVWRLQTTSMINNIRLYRLYVSTGALQ